MGFVNAKSSFSNGFDSFASLDLVCAYTSVLRQTDGSSDVAPWLFFLFFLTHYHGGPSRGFFTQLRVLQLFALINLKRKKNQWGGRTVSFNAQSVHIRTNTLTHLVRKERDICETAKSSVTELYCTT